MIKTLLYPMQNISKMIKKTLYPMQNISTYHLDQKLRGKVSKGLLDFRFLNKPYKTEAILPVALLEYAGIKDIEKIIRKIIIPQSLTHEHPIELYKIKEHLENELKKKLPETLIERRLKERGQRDNDYARPFAQKCISILPSIYNVLIPQLSWDRFSQMQWSKHIRDKYLLKQIRSEIYKFISKENLPILRHCANHLINETNFANTDNEDTDLNYLMEVMKKTKIKNSADIGDCEFIHTAINGQLSADHKQRVAVDCYTMDSVKEIKRRLILCFTFYQVILEYASSQFGFQYKFDPKYYGRIYIVDELGNAKEKIEVNDYPIKEVLLRVKLRDPEILFLLND